jgi:hypothetical protein
MYRGQLWQKVMRVTPKCDVNQLFTNFDRIWMSLKKDMPIHIAANGHILTGRIA